MIPLAVLVSCKEGSIQDYLGPDPYQSVLIGVSISPRDQPSVVTGSSRQFAVSGRWSNGSSAVPAVTWTATGGSIDATGLFTAAQIPGTYWVIARAVGGTQADTAAVSVVAQLTGFRITPKVDTMVSGQTRQFSATLNWSDGQSHPVTISWSTTGGVINTTGVYSPGTLVGSFLVVAACSCGAVDTASVTVRDPIPSASPTLMSLTLAPRVVALALGGVQQFSATGNWSDGTSGPVAVAYAATGGSISSSGLYVAGNTGGSYRVVATQQGGTRADTASVTINAAPVLTQVVLSPPAVAMNPGDTQQFTATGVWSDGSSTPPPVSYSATGGTISSSGLYTAGSTPGTYSVIATQQGGGLADTSAVTIHGPNGPSLTELVMNPSSVSVIPGSNRQFAVSASWSDGSSTLPPLSFSATGGTISSTGLYTAGSTPGAYQVIVRHQGGTLADTSAVTVPSLTGLNLTPDSSAVLAGGSQLFTVTGSWSNGATTPPQVTYTATGGTISPAGLYIAGGTAGTFRVVATHTFGTRADTSVVTITGAALPPPPPPPPPPPGGPGTAELPRVYLNTAYVQPSGRVINVGSGGDLQSALNSAAPGDQIVLSAGATYTGNFQLPTRANCVTGGWMVVRGSSLPPEGVRVNPTTAAAFPKIVTPNVAPAIQATNGSCGWRFIAVEITGTAQSSTTNYNYGLVHLGEGEPTLAAIPHDIILDRVYLHGTATTSVQHGITFNGARLALIESYVSEIHWPGTETHAIGGWTGPGPFKIVNNYLEAAGVNLMFGGADPVISTMHPSDIEIRRNYVFKPPSWLGRGWALKNLFEIKHAQRVLVEGNVFENSWPEAQTGMALNLQSSAQPGNPYPQTADITIRLNLIRNATSCLIVLASDNFGNGVPLARLTFENNWCDQIGSGQTYRGFLLGGALTDIRIARNTLRMTSSTEGGPLYIEFSGAQNISFLENIISPSGNYSPAFMSGGYIGSDALTRYAGTAWTYTGNVIGQQNPIISTAVLPAGNTWLSGPVSFAADGSAPAYPGKGVDITALTAALSGVVP